VYTAVGEEFKTYIKQRITTRKWKVLGEGKNTITMDTKIHEKFQESDLISSN
jgi:hypothetical protein